MTNAEFISRADKYLRKLIFKLPPQFPVFLYSYGRKFFLELLSGETKPDTFRAPEQFSKTLWDIRFGGMLFNAAGMFKNGESYYTVASQGAAAYLAGTTTSNVRKGNIKNYVKHPFAAYPWSGAASNWMGLPNPGHAAVAKKLSSLVHIPGCPVGASLSSDPELSGVAASRSLAEGMAHYQKAGVDFLEINESCPNVPGSKHGEIGTDLIDRLEYISKMFLQKRTGNLPVVVKFSNDTATEQLPELLDILLNLGYDGINLGNTSVWYDIYRKQINNCDTDTYEYFTNVFGGGLSGRILKNRSLELAAKAAEYIHSKELKREFHLIRTGGIFNAKDIRQSAAMGISMNQWFTGYFEMFAAKGHAVYEKLYLQLDKS